MSSATASTSAPSRAANEWKAVTDVGIRTTPREDLYVILAGWTEDGDASFKVFVNPLIMWIWVGGGVLVAGTLIAFWPDAREESRVTERRLRPVGEVETSRV
jgi:cytochrome c biogenesis factor